MIDEKYMKLCFELAQKGLMNVAPNPMVGAVVVHNDVIIGSGYHQKYGEPHAEVNAINSVKNQNLLRESTIYVNLEPCSHYGKTPPCAKLLIDKGIKEVVVCNVDPFPEVSGRGINMLREAGIKVTTGILENEGWYLNRRFFTFHTKHRPYIVLKWAQSADGFIDIIRESAETKPYKFSTDETLLLRNKIRAMYSAILVGSNTALLDNPNLTTNAGNSPVRILIDRELKVPMSYNLYDNNAKTIVFSEKKQTLNTNAENVVLPFDKKTKKLNLQLLLDELYKRKIQSLLVEGGCAILQSFLDNDNWDEIRVEVVKNLKLNNGIKAPICIDFNKFDGEQFGNNTIYNIEKGNFKF